MKTGTGAVGYCLRGTGFIYICDALARNARPFLPSSKVVSPPQSTRKLIKSETDAYV